MDNQIPNMSHNDSYMSPLQHMNLLNVHHNGVQEFMASITAIRYFFTYCHYFVYHCKTCCCTLLQFGGNEAEKPRVDTFAAADRSYEVDQKSASSRDGSVANGVGLNSSNFRWV